MAVRARPLNTFESRVGGESAWEIKQSDYNSRRPAKSQDTNRDAKKLRKVIQLKNTFRFGLKEANERSMTPTMARSKSAAGVRSASNNGRYGTATDKSWKYKSGKAMQAQSVYRQISSIKNGGFQQFTNPLYTPTPVKKEYTPDRALETVSEFNLYGNRASSQAGGHRRGRSVSTRPYQSRTKSLTAN